RMKEDPLVQIQQTTKDLSLTSDRGGVGIRWSDKQIGTPTCFTFTASPLVPLGGRGSVTIAVDGLSGAKASWTENGIEKHHVLAVIEKPLLDFPQVERFRSQSHEFLLAYREALNCVDRTSERTRFNLNCILLSKSGEIVATDSRQLLVRHGFTFPWTEDILIP